GPPGLEQRGAKRPARSAGGARPILVVDDDAAVRRLVGLLLAHGGGAVVEAPDGAVALAVADRGPPAAVVARPRVPREARPGLAPVRVGAGGVDAGGRAAEVAADGRLATPFDLDELLRAVSRRARWAAP